MVNEHLFLTVNVRAAEDASREARTAMENILVVVSFKKARLAYTRRKKSQYLYTVSLTKNCNAVTSLGSHPLRCCVACDQAARWHPLCWPEWQAQVCLQRPHASTRTYRVPVLKLFPPEPLHTISVRVFISSAEKPSFKFLFSPYD